MYYKIEKDVEITKEELVDNLKYYKDTLNDIIKNIEKIKTSELPTSKVSEEYDEILWSINSVNNTVEFEINENIEDARYLEEDKIEKLGGSNEL